VTAAHPLVLLKLVMFDLEDLLLQVIVALNEEMDYLQTLQKILECLFEEMD